MNTTRFKQYGKQLFIGLTLLSSTNLFAQSIDAAKSKINISFKYSGMSADANFKKFNGTVQFNPNDLTKANAKIDIDMRSLDMGDPNYNNEIAKADWFNSSKYSTANFTSSQIKASGNNRYDVNGKLTIKGKSIDVKFPATLSTQGNARVFEGTLPIKRLDFNIGEGDWQDTSVIANEVIIKFKITTN